MALFILQFCSIINLAKYIMRFLKGKEEEEKEEEIEIQCQNLSLV